MNLENICKEVIKVAKEAGAFVKKEAATFDIANIEYKGAKDLVSYVDKKSEEIIVNGLHKILPEASFITEEGTIEKKENDLQWVIDPLDGTTNFLHQLPSYSMCIALMHKKEIIVGVVYEPNRDECFYAWKNGGAWCNEKKIQVSPIKELDKSLLVMGFPYKLLGKEETYFRIMRDFVDVTHGLRRLGSAAIDLCYVACGRFEAFYEYNLQIWDIAAGILIVQEAGGKISDFEGGNDYLYGKEVLAAGAAHAEVLKVIKRHWK
ncbi:MAG: inositol monophosphatase [Cytophagaceae bacterium]|nr:inositol monophosphatase [Cytophagaceae bacterium]